MNKLYLIDVCTKTPKFNKNEANTLKFVKHERRKKLQDNGKMDGFFLVNISPYITRTPVVFLNYQFNWKYSKKLSL